MRQRPGPSLAVLEGLLLGETAPHRAERRRIEQPALIVGHPRDPLHPFSDSGMLAEELPNARLVEADSLLEWRISPERLDGELAEFVEEPMAGVSRVLSRSQLETLAQHGEERTAEVGEKLFEIGDASYPFIAILEGEAAVNDAAGHEIVRHGASGFLGEMNLLSGQTVFLTAVVTKPMRYIAVDREVLRQLLFDDSELSDLLLTAFVQRRELLQQRQGVGVEIVGPRDSEETRRLLDFARRMKTPYSWLDPEQDLEAAALLEPLVRGRDPAGAAAGRGRAAAAEQRRALAGARRRPASWPRARRSTCW